MKKESLFSFVSTTILRKCSLATFATYAAALGFLNSTHAQTVDSFNPSANGSVVAIAFDPDGKILLGGAFTSIAGQTRNRIARLHPNGALDTTFNPNANSAVTSIVVDIDGTILVGGAFTQIGGYTRNRIARLNPDGSVNTAFNPNANGVVECIAGWGSAIYVGGSFTSIGGRTRNLVAKLNADGTASSTFNANVVGTVVKTIATSGGYTFIGGGFSQVNGQARNNLAQLLGSGGVVPDFDLNVNGVVNCIAVMKRPWSKTLYIGGSFTSIGGKTRNYLAAVDQSGGSGAGVVTSFSPNLDGPVQSVAIQNGPEIIVGGSFGSVGGVAQVGIARLLEDGSLDSIWADEAFGGGVSGVAIQNDGRILLGGTFTSVSGQSRSRIARLINGRHYTRLVAAASQGGFYWERLGPGPRFFLASLSIWDRDHWEPVSTSQYEYYDMDYYGGSLGPGLFFDSNGWVVPGTYRARGYMTGGGSNASTSWVDETNTFSPQLTVSGNLNFGTVPVGQSASRVLTVSNSGNIGYNFQTSVIPPGYSVVRGTNFVVEPLKSEEFEIRFSPTSEQNYSGDLIIGSVPFQYQYLEIDPVVIPVSGTGGDPNSTVTIGPGVGVPMRVQKLVGWGTYNQYLGYSLEVVAGDLYPNGHFVPLPQDQQWQTLADDGANDGFLEIGVYYLFGPYEFQPQYEAIYPWVDLIPHSSHGPGKNGHWRIVYLGSPSYSSSQAALTSQIRKLQKAVRSAKKNNDDRKVKALNRKLAVLRKRLSSV